MRDFLLIVHLLAVVVWIGGGIALNTITTRTPPEHRPQVIPQISWYGNKVLTGSSVVLILAGFGLVAEMDISLGSTWILIALAIWVISGAIGGGVIGRAAEKLKELAGAEGPKDVAQMESLYKRIILFSRLDILLLVGAVVDMVVKPGA
jgi:uncharacterized membrane protein